MEAATAPGCHLPAEGWILTGGGGCVAWSGGGGVAWSGGGVDCSDDGDGMDGGGDVAVKDFSLIVVSFYFRLLLL